MSLNGYYGTQAGYQKKTHSSCRICCRSCSEIPHCQAYWQRGYGQTINTDFLFIMLPPPDRHYMMSSLVHLLCEDQRYSDTQDHASRYENRSNSNPSQLGSQGQHHSNKVTPVLHRIVLRKKMDKLKAEI